jgi:hypothetical protein
MKNKHLVLIVFCTVLLGVVFRYFPVSGEGISHKDLLRLEPSSVEHIFLKKNAEQSFRFIRVGTQWIYENGGNLVPVPAGILDSLLAGVCPLISEGLISKPKEDSLGLNARAWTLQLETGDGRLEELLIGPPFADEELGQCTYVKLPAHQGVYQIKGNLRAAISINPDAWIQESLICKLPGPTNRLEIQRLGQDTLAWERIDSLGLWQQLNSTQKLVSSDSMDRWVSWIASLATKSEPAPFFNELRAEERRIAQIDLDTDTAFLTLNLYFLPQPDVPDEFRRLEHKPRAQASYIIQSSAQPAKWYVLYDTALAQRIYRDYFPSEDYEK